MMTMKMLWIVLAAPAAAMLLFPPATDASGGSCRPRTLTPAERQAGERVGARLHPLLPRRRPDGKSTARTRLTSSAARARMARESPSLSP